MSVADYNTDPNSNTSISGINIAEGCPPSGINNAIRQMMADIKDKADSTDTAITTLDANVVKLSGNQNVGGTKTFTDGLVTNGNIATVRTATISGQSVTHNCQLTMSGTSLNYGLYDTTNGKWIIACGPEGKPFFSSTIYGLTNVCLSRDRNNAELTFYGGTTATDGAIMCLYGGETGFSGQFRMRAAKDGTYRDLIGNYNGNLTWGGNNVITAAGGTFTGVVTINNQTNARSIIPNISNSYTLGVSGARWKEIWCNQSSINTSSDERIKQQIANIPDAVLDAWGDVEWIQFKYNDSVEEKGAEKARLHNGLIAQRVEGAFKAHGLDASKYGLFLYDQWGAEPEQKDENGNVTIPAQEAGDAYGLRYTEALCMEAAYQRRRADRAEARISALERRLDEMEAVLATLGA